MVDNLKKYPHLLSKNSNEEIQQTLRRLKKKADSGNVSVNPWTIDAPTQDEETPMQNTIYAVKTPLNE